MSLLVVVLVVLAIVLFGLGAVVEGLLWLVAVGVIFLIAAVAFGVGQVRKRT